MVTGETHGIVMITLLATQAILSIDPVPSKLHWITTLTKTYVNILMITSVKILVSKNISVENFVATISRTHPCSINYVTTSRIKEDDMGTKCVKAFPAAFICLKLTVGVKFVQSEQ